MTMHLAWIRIAAATATTILTFGGQWAAGQSQYGPYATTPPYATSNYAQTQYSDTRYSATQPSETVPPSTPIAPYGVQPTPPSQVSDQSPTAYPTTAYPTTSDATYYMAARNSYSFKPAQAASQPANPQTSPAKTQQRYTPAPAATSASTPYQPPRYQAPGSSPAYPSLAQQPNGTMMPGKPAMAPASSNVLPTPTPTPAPGVNAAMPSPSTDSYFASDPGTMGCNANDYGYGACGAMDDCDDGSQWFGGVYGLYMTRSKPAYRRYTVGVDSAATGTPYFPTAADTENQSDCPFLVPHWRGGIEVRLGSTFGIGDSCDYGDDGYGCDTGGCNGGCNSCGNNSCGCQPCCTPCCQQMYAWEFAYWGLDRERQDQFVDGPLTATFRYYGMINYAGLEYDPGSGAQPVNDFYNYQSPITGTGTETVLAQRVRTNFWCENLELNILRLPLYSGGCGCGGCGECGPDFTLTGLCGVRYFRVDDDFGLDTEWDDGSGPFNGFDHNSSNELFHNIRMENNLVGFQLGADMNYCCATRWNFFWDTNFGLYNNYITQDQRIFNGLGFPVTFSQDGRSATVESKKNDVAFLGEMRLGGGYLLSSHWRAIAAYRAIAISGVALAPDQIKPTYDNWTDTARINADGSIIIHGIQAGFECNY